MKKIIVCMVILLTVGAMLSACGKDTRSSEEYITLYSQKSFSDGLVVLSEQDEDCSNIFYYDYTNDSEVYACSQANCSHSISEYKSGEINCNAIVEGEVLYPFLYEDKLYYFVKKNSSESLWRSNADGTDKEKIVDLDFILYEGTYVTANGKIYVAESVTEEIEDNEHSSYIATVQSEVYEIDIDGKSVRRITDFGKKGSSICRRIWCFDNKLYMKYSTSDNTYEEAGFENDSDYLEWMTSDDFSYAKDIKKFGKKENYYTYDLESKEIELLDIDFQGNFEPYDGLDNMDYYEIICIYGSKMYYLDSVTANYTIYSCDLETGEKEEIISKYQLCYTYKSGSIYITGVDMDESTKDELIPSADLNTEPKYYIFDVTSEDMVEQNYGEDGKFFYVADVNEDGLLAYENDYDESYNFIDDHSFVEISKDKITD